ncbi:unnamed protein product [Chondrus crispus]|uniref:Uncharacterized protein n=1 Tax=Chondrus crispus TaxID=2769 RepID=R7Q0I8_CHOCR|nr:unnamed protein product [Chondrus crispus]CDF32167.1 unnamed protein product [Chondrus crispus]|eukprot:XP_005711832.1 unnamed protein product [Chondrus crispus]
MAKVMMTWLSLHSSVGVSYRTKNKRKSQSSAVLALVDLATSIRTSKGLIPISSKIISRPFRDTTRLHSSDDFACLGLYLTVYIHMALKRKGHIYSAVRCTATAQNPSLATYCGSASYAMVPRQIQWTSISDSVRRLVYYLSRRSVRSYWTFLGKSTFVNQMRLT